MSYLFFLINIQIVYLICKNSKNIWENYDSKFIDVFFHVIYDTSEHMYKLVEHVKIKNAIIQNMKIFIYLSNCLTDRTKDLQF